MSNVIDTYVHHTWQSLSELQAYMSDGWAAFVGRPGDLPGGRGQISVLPPRSFEHPFGGYLPETEGGSAPPGSSVSEMRAALARMGCKRAVLGFDHALLAPAMLNPYLALEVTRAANAWTLDTWLGDPQSELYGLVLAPNHLPQDAAAEIRSAGAHERMVGVVLCGNGLGRPFGNPLYEPIFEAAAEMSLPVILHVGGDIPPNTPSHPTAGGVPTTFAEFHALRAQSLQTHVTSLIVHGTLQRHPDLKVLLAGAGTNWIPSWLWRLDSDFRAQGARETPWLKTLPSEQFFRQIRVTSYSGPKGSAVEANAAIAAALPQLEDIVCYASGYPRWDAEQPEEAASRYPREWTHKVLGENAESLFRWPQPADTHPARKVKS